MNTSSRMLGVSIVLSMLAAAPAWAQRIEFEPVVATVTTTAPIHGQAPDVDELKIGRSYTFGARATYLLSTHKGVEAQWTWQNTNMRLNDVSLFVMEVSRVDANFVYTFGENDRGIRPFLTAGAGVATLFATDIETASKFAWNVGAGAKWFFTRSLGSRFDARYTPVQLNTRSSGFCAPFSFCQSALQPFQLQAALLIRF